MRERSMKDERQKGRKEEDGGEGKQQEVKWDIRIIPPNVVPPYFQSFYSSC